MDLLGLTYTSPKRWPTARRAANKPLLETGLAWTNQQATRTSRRDSQWRIKSRTWRATSWWFNKSRLTASRKMEATSIRINPIWITKTIRWCIWVPAAWETWGSPSTWLQSANCRSRIKDQGWPMELSFKSWTVISLNQRQISRINGSISLMTARISKFYLWPIIIIRIIPMGMACNNRITCRQEARAWCRLMLRAISISKMRVLNFHFPIVLQQTP